MAFISYTSSEKTYLPDFISLTESKTINFSKGFIIKNNLSSASYKYAVLAFDPPAHSVRIKLLKDSEQDCFTITYDKRGKGSTIACGNFINFFGISLKKYSGQYTYKNKSTKDEKIFIFELRDQNGTH